jgi:5'-nucleotidase
LEVFGLKPLVLVTNDDGIGSRGLWAMAEAVLPLGDVLVVAPLRQWSGCGRAMPPDVTFAVSDASRRVLGHLVPAYAVDASPAQCVALALLDLATRRPQLVVSGANHGANLSIEVTVSGTVGASIEAAAFGVPALAVSLEMDPRYFHTGDPQADYRATQHTVAALGRHILQHGLPHGVDALNINIPRAALPTAPRRITRLSRARYFVPLPPDRACGQDRPGYKLLDDMSGAEPDSDIRALLVERAVSISPLCVDMTTPMAMVSRSLELDLCCLGQEQPALVGIVPLPALQAAPA